MQLVTRQAYDFGLGCRLLRSAWDFPQPDHHWIAVLGMNLSKALGIVNGAPGYPGQTISLLFVTPYSETAKLLQNTG